MAFRNAFYQCWATSTSHDTETGYTGTWQQYSKTFSIDDAAPIKEQCSVEPGYRNAGSSFGTPTDRVRKSQSLYFCRWLVVCLKELPGHTCIVGIISRHLHNVVHFHSRHSEFLKDSDEKLGKIRGSMMLKQLYRT